MKHVWSSLRVNQTDMQVLVGILLASFLTVWLHPRALPAAFGIGVILILAMAGRPLWLGMAARGKVGSGLALLITAVLAAVAGGMIMRLFNVSMGIDPSAFTLDPFKGLQGIGVAVMVGGTSFGLSTSSTRPRAALVSSFLSLTSGLWLTGAGLYWPQTPSVPPQLWACGIMMLVMFIFLSMEPQDAVISASPVRRVGRWRTLGLTGLAVVITMALAFPVGIVTLFMQQQPTGLFDTHASGHIVFKAKFLSDRPQELYWRNRAIYHTPHSEILWIAARENDPELAREETMVAMDATHVEYLVAHGNALAGNKNDAYEGPGYLDGSHGKHEEGSTHRPFVGVAHFAYQYEDGQPPNPVYTSISLKKNLTHPDLSRARRDMPRTYALVQDWVHEGLDDRAMVQRALVYFHANLAYHYDHQSLEPERTRVDHFLFVEQKGVCRHFANAFVMMMRMGGVPARLVTGHMGGDDEPGTGWINVRMRNAHAWAEVWFEGTGWVRVDPTAVVRVEKGIPPLSSLSGFFGFLMGWGSNPDFSVLGEAGNSGSGGWALPQIWSRQLGLVMISVLLAVWVGLRWKARRHIAPEDRAWHQLVRCLQRRGYDVQPFHGPATVGQMLSPYLNEEQRQVWWEAVGDYERWKFAGIQTPGLVRALRQARRMCRRPDQSRDGATNASANG